MRQDFWNTLQKRRDVVVKYRVAVIDPVYSGMTSLSKTYFNEAREAASLRQSWPWTFETEQRCSCLGFPLPTLRIMYDSVWSGLFRICNALYVFRWMIWDGLSDSGTLISIIDVHEIQTFVRHDRFSI